MTTKFNFLITPLLFLFAIKSYSQDTLIINNNYKYKFGVKLISERSGNPNYTYKTFDVACGGLQAIRKFKNTKSSIESGLYLITKARQYNYPIIDSTITGYNFYYVGYDVYYYYLSLPVNYRLDTKWVYFSGGIFMDYLVYKTSGPTTEANIKSDEDYATDRKILFGYNLNLGVEKYISQSLNIFFEARYAVTVSSAKTDGDLYSSLYESEYSNINYGFGVGVNYKLIK